MTLLYLLSLIDKSFTLLKRENLNCSQLLRWDKEKGTKYCSVSSTCNCNFECNFSFFVANFCFDSVHLLVICILFVVWLLGKMQIIQLALWLKGWVKLPFGMLFGRGGYLNSVVTFKREKFFQICGQPGTANISIHT